MRKYNSIFGAKEKSTTKPEKQTKTSKTKTKAKTKEKVEPKKRGRPTNAELAAKAKEKRNTEIALRKQLIERQKSTTVSGSASTTVEYNENDERVYPEYKTDFSTKVPDPNWIPPWPVFLPGQRVEYVLKQKDGKPYKGTVGIDDIYSAFIRVAWDDGSNQFHAKKSLKLIEKKTYKSLLKAKKNEGK